MDSLLSSKAGTKHDILGDIQLTRSTFVKLRNVWHVNNTTTVTKF